MHEGLPVQGDVTNLFEKDHASTVGPTGFPDNGYAQAPLVGAPQQSFLTPRKEF